MPSVESRSNIKHVAIIGAGIVGSSCAWHLRKNGYEVSLIDPVLPGQSTSYGNAGCLSTSNVTPFSYPGVIRDIPAWLFDPLGPLSIRWPDFPGLIPWFWRFWRSSALPAYEHISRAQTKLMNQTAADFDEILAAVNIEHLRKSNGAISIYDNRAGFEKDLWQYEFKESLGFEWQYLGPAELKIMVPQIRLEGGVAIYHADWQHLIDPGAVSAKIAENVFANGGTWLQDRVKKVESSETGVSLATESGRNINADALVVAAGAWSNSIAGQLDYKVPMTAKRGYHSMLANSGIEMGYPVTSMSRSFVMTPMQAGLRLAGTAEFAALDAEPDYERAKVLVKHAQHYFPDLNCDEVGQWMGQRPMMADSLPVISESPSRHNVFYAFGHGHYGLTQGPTTGKIIATLIAGHEPDIEIHDYRFERFRD
ncbi:MAG: D-amino-acid dehydrogenase [Lysobacterales bacterium]|jgi:D-amino-acid dehydrogenase